MYKQTLVHTIGTDTHIYTFLEAVFWRHHQSVKVYLHVTTVSLQAYIGRPTAFFTDSNPPTSQEYIWVHERSRCQTETHRQTDRRTNLCMYRVRRKGCSLLRKINACGHSIKTGKTKSAAFSLVFYVLQKTLPFGERLALMYQSSNFWTCLMNCLGVPPPPAKHRVSPSSPFF